MNKKFFKHLIAIIMITLVCTTNVLSVFANEPRNNATKNTSIQHEFKFRDFIYSEKIDLDDYRVEYTSDQFSETYLIYDKNNVLYEELTINYPQVSTLSSTRTSFFTKDKTISSSSRKLATVRFTACVTLYSSGSFRSFEDLRYTDLGIVDKACDMEIESYSADAWSNTGKFPCTQLDYAYTAHLMSPASMEIGFGADLISAGFTFNMYYRKSINSSGSFKLYS